MALFGGGSGKLLERLARQEWRNEADRDALLEQFKGERVALPDMLFMLWSPDRQVRAVGFQRIAEGADSRTVERLIKALADVPRAQARGVARNVSRMNLPNWEAEATRGLAHKDAAQRQVAEDIVLEAPLSKSIYERLVELLRHPEQGTRERALARCLETRDPRFLDFLTVLIEKEELEDGVRKRVWQALRDSGDPRYLDLYCDWLGKESHANREVLADAIARFAVSAYDSRLTDKVLQLLAGGEPGPRTAAMWILARLQDRTAAVRKFLLFAKKLPGWVRERAFESMRDLGEGLGEVVADLLRDQDPEIRASALFLASSIEPDARLVEPILALLDDGDWWIRVNAIDGLGHQKDTRAVPRLLPLLADEELRGSAIDALAAIGDGAALQPIVNLLRDAEPEIRMDVLRALRQFGDPRTLRILQKLAEVDPDAMVRAEAYAVARQIADTHKLALPNEAGMITGMNRAAGVDAASPVLSLLLQARALGASDVHMGVGMVAQARVQGELTPLPGVAASDDPAAFQGHLMSLLKEEDRRRLADQLQVDICLSVANAGRFRGNIYLDRRGPAAVFRVIPTRLPTLASCGLPAVVGDVATFHQGLVLVCGPGGSGKTTTLAALIGLINDTRHAHVITLEDPIEFVHPNRSSVINQRELGSHTKSYAKALRAALRENPDVIVVGDLRDRETTRLALEAAETGHLVVTTLPSTSAPRAIDRVINDFAPDEQPQVRIMLSGALKLVVAQSLVPRADGKGMAAAFEVLVGLMTVGNIIRDAKLQMLESVIQTGRSQGMQTFDDALMDLVRAGTVKPEVAYFRARNKEPFEALVDPAFLEGAVA